MLTEEPTLPPVKQETDDLRPSISLLDQDVVVIDGTRPSRDGRGTSTRSSPHERRTSSCGAGAYTGSSTARRAQLPRPACRGGGRGSAGVQRELREIRVTCRASRTSFEQHKSSRLHLAASKVAPADSLVHGTALSTKTQTLTTSTRGPRRSETPLDADLEATMCFFVGAVIAIFGEFNSGFTHRWAQPIFRGFLIRCRAQLLQKRVTGPNLSAKVNGPIISRTSVGALQDSDFRSKAWNCFDPIHLTFHPSAAENQFDEGAVMAQGIAGSPRERRSRNAIQTPESVCRLGSFRLLVLAQFGVAAAGARWSLGDGSVRRNVPSRPRHVAGADDNRLTKSRLRAVFCCAVFCAFADRARSQGDC